MRISDKQKNIILSVLDFLCLLLVGFVIYKFLSPYTYIPIMFRGENFYVPYWNVYNFDIDNTPSQVFAACDHAWYFNSIVNVLTQKYLADFLQLHPVIYLEKYHVFFLFGYYMLLLFSLLGNFTKYFTKTKFTCLLIPFIALFFLHPVINECLIWLLYHSFWGYSYIFMTVFLFVFLSRIEYFYVNSEKPSKRELFSIIFLILFLSVSHEFHRFILCFASLIIFIAHKLIFKTEFKRRYLLYWLLLILACSLNFLNKIFVYWFTERCIFTSNYTDNGIFSLQYLAQYFSGYFDYLIKRNILLINILSILLAMIHFFVGDKEKNKRFFIYILSLLFSIYAFFVIIIVGNEYSNFSYEHYGLRFTLIAFYVYCILSAFGYLLKMSDNKKLKISLAVMAFLQLFISFGMPDFKKATLFENNYSQDIKKTAYIMEKMFVLYGKEHKRYYYIGNEWDINPTSIIYLLYRYDKNSSRKNYKAIEVCKTDLNLEKSPGCRNKFLKIFEQKTGQTITEEELEKHDFSVFDKYLE